MVVVYRVEHFDQESKSDAESQLKCKFLFCLRYMMEDETTKRSH